jgi:transcription antitermination factor NusG
MRDISPYELIPMAWWALRAVPRCELPARDRLEAVGVRAFVPHEVYRDRRRVGRRWKMVDVAAVLYPLYLFADTLSWKPLLQVRGVAAVMRNGTGAPLEVPERDMRRLLDVADARGLIVDGAEVRLSLDFRARVDDVFEFVLGSAFAGQRGRVTSLRRLESHGEVTAEVSVLGSRRVVNVPYRSVGDVIGHPGARAVAA